MTASTNGASTRRPSVGPGLDTFCDSVVQLARNLPMPVQRLSLHVGELAVDVEFASPSPTGGAVPVVIDVVETSGPPATEPAESGTIVRSELVGTFFAAPAPGAEPFIHVGQSVDEGQQLGIVEAMKLMNPVLAPCAGMVLRGHVDDGQAVEYDEPLFTLQSAEWQ